jgi:hypothetical protein
VLCSRGQACRQEKQVQVLGKGAAETRGLKAFQVAQRSSRRTGAGSLGTFANVRPATRESSHPTGVLAPVPFLSPGSNRLTQLRSLSPSLTARCSLSSVCPFQAVCCLAALARPTGGRRCPSLPCRLHRSHAERRCSSRFHGPTDAVGSLNRSSLQVHM